MSDYIKFEDLKVGEYYDVYGNNADLLAKNANYECKLSGGELVFRFFDGGRVVVVAREDNWKFKLHKEPLLTDESIGKWYEDNEGDKFKMHGKIEVEGDICFVGMPKCYKSHATLFLENGKARCNQASDWFLIKEVE